MEKQANSTQFNEARQLTGAELELMSILWAIGEGSVSDVIERLPVERKLAYTSVSTILRILEQKKVVTTRKEGRGHIYMPVMIKSEYESRAVRHVVDKVFNGVPSALVKQLLGSMKLGKSELDEIRQIIEKSGGGE